MVRPKGNLGLFKRRQTMNQSEIKRQESRPASSPFLVLGVGNTLLSDEGVGVHVIEAMKKMNPLPDTELIDGGTALVELLDILANREKVIVIDAVKYDGKPGSIYRFTPEEVSVLKQSQVSVHQIGVLEALKMAELAGWKPRQVIILGIEPKTVDWGLELSPEVARAIPIVIKLVIEELGKVKPGG
jgi:hydrogenase maturation protease